MAKVVDLKLWQEEKDLGGLEDPCSKCSKEDTCINTCEYAANWWDKVAEKFKKRGVKNKLGI